VVDPATDELTGLATRRALTAALEAVDGPVAVLVADLEGFKELNDTLGHAAGDTLLREVAGRLRAALGARWILGRFGGDEFALALPGGGLAAATDAARRVAVALQEPFVLDGLEVLVDASVGAALGPTHGTDPDTLLQRADVATSQAKEARDGFRVYAGVRDRHARERLTLLAELRRALERDELVLHFQPKVALADGHVAGAEALVRWQHPRHGLRGPGAFLPHAEHAAVMRPLTLHVLDRALRALAGWRADGMDLHVAVNLSVQNLLDVRTPHHVAEALEAHGVPPEALTLEVTERLLLADPRRAADVLGELRRLGVRLALDDFGTGFSSLEHLKRLPVDELKIDKSFVMRMDEDAADRAIVASTAALAHALGLRVVAEGVESATSAAVLAAIGCDLAQGFHFSPPVPGERIPALVDGRLVGVADLGPSAGARRPSRPAAATPRPAT
jgi:diguanylate cyclase (GGDEF)-like protein